MSTRKTSMSYSSANQTARQARQQVRHDRFCAWVEDLPDRATNARQRAIQSVYGTPRRWAMGFVQLHPFYDVTTLRWLIDRLALREWRAAR